MYVYAHTETIETSGGVRNNGYSRPHVDMEHEKNKSKQNKTKHFFLNIFVGKVLWMWPR